MAMVFGRSSWGALPPHWVSAPVASVDAFVIHHSVTTQPTSYDESIALVQQIQRQHLGKVKPDGKYEYADIAYNVLAGWNCALVGRGVSLSDGATDDDPTTRTWSICVLGDYTKDLVTPEIRAGIVAALQLGFDLYGTHPLRPHRDYYATACPGENLIAAIPSFESEADMTPDEFFGHNLVLLEEPGPHPRQATVQEWFEWVHREFQVMRIALERLEAKL